MKSGIELLPEAFVRRIHDQLGEEVDAFLDSFRQAAPTSIRLHPRKGVLPFESSGMVPWCEDGYYLPTRPLFHMDPHWHGGAYYVQEASSMILDYVLRQLPLKKESKVWLDMCAAPGGKTGILAKYMHPCDVLLANEVVSQRRLILKENLIKGGYANVFVSGLHANQLKQPIADIILVDAPCAGEGMMRKDQEAIHQWSPDLVRECAFLQKNILNEIQQALHHEGYLIYSTCSYSNEENIENIASLICEGAFTPVEINFPGEWGIKTITQQHAVGYQLFPHRVRGEGLFISVIQKRREQPVVMQGKGRKQKAFFADLPEWLGAHLNFPEKYSAWQNGDEYYVVDKTSAGVVNHILHSFPGIVCMSSAGQLKGKDFIPSHYLAMSGIQSRAYSIISLDAENALDYLERKTPSMVAVEKNGWHLISFEGTLLGWAKKTSHGWKNHYPMDWRLRMRKKPD